MTTTKTGHIATASELKSSQSASINFAGWTMYWSFSRDVYVVRPLDIDRNGGDEFSTYSDALAALRSFACEAR